MKEIVLVKYGEIILKGLNRASFEDCLLRNIKKALYDSGLYAKVTKEQAAIYVEPDDDTDIDMVVMRLKKVFGIVLVSKVICCEKDLDTIKKVSRDYLGDLLSLAKTFKVETKRADKTYPIKSPEVSMEVGGFLLESFKNLSVDVKNPDETVFVEIRPNYCYIYSKREKGAGGMPVSSNGYASLLLSGGIDSPVAGYMIAKRGVKLNCVHFHSYPYTSERAKEKVLSLAKILASYNGETKVYVVPFTEAQLAIRDNCPEEQLTVIMRRLMMQIAEKIAEKTGCKALITGESIGQVASQTIEALSVTNESVSMPVFRPLIGMDKEEIIKISRKIGSFETSILPYEDCCTVFTPKHPKTKPILEKIKLSETKIDVEGIIQRCIDNIEKIVVKG